MEFAVSFEWLSVSVKSHPPAHQRCPRISGCAWRSSGVSWRCENEVAGADCIRCTV